MQSETLVKNIKIIKNNTRPVDETVFPNIDIREQVLQGALDKDKRYTRLYSRIPIIRGDVYLIAMIYRFEDYADTPSRLKEYIQRFLQEANIIQQRYVVQDNLMVVEAFNNEQLIYKMEY